MTREALEAEIREVILASVDMDGLDATVLTSNAQLFGEGVGLDSIDALEIGAALRRKFQINVKANAEENKGHFRTIRTLADFIAEQTGLVLE